MPAKLKRAAPSPRARRKKPPRIRETAAEKKARVARIWRGLVERWPDPRCALLHRNAFELLVATILSAQCTDSRVNQVTPELFARYLDAPALARAKTADVERLIRSTGFYHNKAKSLIGASRRIVEAYGGEAPKTMEELLTLPGVARKTANVVLGTAHGIASGVVVDTHVQRVSGRLALTRETDPKKIEKDLVALFPPEDWVRLGHTLIHHGRGICHARKPDCAACPVEADCPSSLLKRPPR